MELLPRVEGLVDALYWSTVHDAPEARLRALTQLSRAVSCEGANAEHGSLWSPSNPLVDSIQIHA